MYSGYEKQDNQLSGMSLSKQKKLIQEEITNKTRLGELYGIQTDMSKSDSVVDMLLRKMNVKITQKIALQEEKKIWQWITNEVEMRKEIVPIAMYFQGPAGIELAEIVLNKSFLCICAQVTTPLNGYWMCPIRKWNMGVSSCNAGCLKHEIGEYRRAKTWQDAAIASKKMVALCKMELDRLEGYSVQ